MGNCIYSPITATTSYEFIVVFLDGIQLESQKSEYIYRSFRTAKKAGIKCAQGFHRPISVTIVRHYRTRSVQIDAVLFTNEGTNRSCQPIHFFSGQVRNLSRSANFDPSDTDSCYRQFRRRLVTSECLLCLGINLCSIVAKYAIS